jgi:FkbM family methyltransferase
MRQFLSTTLNRLGYDLRRNDPRRTLAGALSQAHLAGLAPASIVDVGAAFGAFTETCQGVFPSARYLAVEPLEEHRPKLAALTRKYSNTEFVIAAAAPKAGTLTLQVHPDLDGSSLYLEQAIAGVNGVPRAVEAVTLDGLSARFGLAGPFLLKLDVQGAELAVLEGAPAVLAATEYALLEVSLFEFFDGGPVLNDVLDFMRTSGFSVYDVLGWQYRPLDQALAQLDMAFVKTDGALRASRAYATASQRTAQWQQFSGNQ